MGRSPKRIPPVDVLNCPHCDRPMEAGASCSTVGQLVFWLVCAPSKHGAQGAPDSVGDSGSLFASQIRPDLADVLLPVSLEDKEPRAAARDPPSNRVRASASALSLDIAP